MKNRANPPVFFGMEVDRSTCERRKFFGLPVMVDVAMGDEDAFDVTKIKAKGLHPFSQGVERGLCLNSRIHQGPGRIVDEVDIGRLQRKRDRKLNPVDSVGDWSHHKNLRYHRIFHFSKFDFLRSEEISLKQIGVIVF